MSRESLFVGAFVCFLAAALVGWAMCNDFSPEDLNQYGKIDAFMEMGR